MSTDDDWLAAVKTPVIKVPPTGTGKVAKGAKAAKAVDPSIEGARTTLLGFLDKFEVSRQCLCDRRDGKNWTGTPTEAVAAKREVWNGVWRGIADMVDSVAKAADGYVRPYCEFRKTFADWATGPERQLRYELALKEFGHDTVRMDAECRHIRPVHCPHEVNHVQGQRSLYRLMEDRLPRRHINRCGASVQEYWDNVFKGVPTRKRG